MQAKRNSRATKAASQFNISSIHANSLYRALTNIYMVNYPDASLEHVQKMANEQMLACLDRIQAELNSKNGNSPRKD